MVAFLAFAMIASGCEEAMEEYGISVDENALVGGDRSDTLKHCVAESTVYSERDNRLISEPEDNEFVCFSTFSQAIEFATDGRVILPEDATPETVTDEEINGSIGDIGTTYVIGIEYEHSNYNGYTYTFTNSVTCNGYTHSFSRITGWWNDRISSARAYSDCNHSIHYEHSNFGGATRDCGTACSYIGDAMNDRTSSLKWYK